MELTIYIDVLWLRTFFVELNVCLFLNLWMKQVCPTVRILWMCICFASAEAVLFLLVGYGILFAVGSFILRVLLVFVLYRPQTKGIFLRMLLWSHAATIAAGGILGICHEHLPDDVWFPAGTVLCAIGVLTSVILEERREHHDRYLYKIRLYCNGNHVDVLGFLDTGNKLMDPYVHAPVNILAQSQLERLMPEPQNFRLIPFSSVGAAKQLMKVWSIDAMEAYGRRWEHVVIGVAEDILFEGKDYRLILSAGLGSLN